MQNKNHNKIKQSAKLNYCAPFFWKKIYLYLAHPVMKMAEKYVYYRSSIIPKTLINSEVKIYSGKKWNKKYINRWIVGFKFGEFTWNRRLAIYKAKQLRKKKKKK